MRKYKGIIEIECVAATCGTKSNCDPECLSCKDGRGHVVNTEGRKVGAYKEIAAPVETPEAEKTEETAGDGEKNKKRR